METTNQQKVDAVTVKPEYSTPYEEYSRYHWLLEGDRLLRREFADRLNVCTHSFQRWEKNILNHSAIVADYVDERFNKHGLDKYQRFILLWIYVNKYHRKANKSQTTYQALQFRLRLLITRKVICRKGFYQYLEMRNADKKERDN
ncbi:MAG: hypothetical protein WBF90_33960 [Rivularia sp. (in: cyanobacteria)]